MSASRIERVDRRFERHPGAISRDARKERAEDLAELFGFGFTVLARVVSLHHMREPERQQTSGSVAKSR